MTAFGEIISGFLIRKQDTIYEGIRILSFFHFQISISPHSNTTMVIAQTKDRGTFDMSCTPYHRSAGENKRDAIIAVGVGLGCHQSKALALDPIEKLELSLRFF